MTKKSVKGGASRWKGDEVEKQPSDAAERAAERAEGNEPVRVDAEARRLHTPDVAEGDEALRRARHGDEPEEDLTEAAEEHRARDAREQPPRGKL